MSEFFQRLKQRKLVQWAIAYVAAAFALLQGLDIVATRFDLPSQTIRLVILAMIVGFFVTLVLAWYHGERGAQRVSGTELIILGLILAVGGGFLWRFSATRVVASNQTPSSPNETKTPVNVPAKSIAVLPFENLSSDKDNAYFAEGIQDEILTRLSKIAALKVISRTSTQKYQSAPENLREIGNQLGVANILEGSVQKIANAVHVNVQLIRVASDEHLWAESYNRNLDDVFAVEGEVAGTIAQQLNATLTGAEQKAVSDQPTQNTAAYDAYLRGLAIENNEYNYGAYERAAAAHAQAVQLDPKFALAWARLGVLRSFLYFNDVDRKTNTADAVKEAADRAMSLAPDAGESWVAQGAYRYRVYAISKARPPPTGRRRNCCRIIPTSWSTSPSFCAASADGRNRRTVSKKRSSSIRATWPCSAASEANFTPIFGALPTRRLRSTGPSPFRPMRTLLIRPRRVFFKPKVDSTRLRRNSPKYPPIQMMTLFC